MVGPSQRMIVSSCGSLDVLEGVWPQVCGSGWEILVVMLGRGTASLLEPAGQVVLRMGRTKALGTVRVWSEPGGCWKLLGTSRAYNASLQPSVPSSGGHVVGSCDGNLTCPQRLGRQPHRPCPSLEGLPLLMSLGR